MLNRPWEAKPTKCAARQPTHRIADRITDGGRRYAFALHLANHCSAHHIAHDRVADRVPDHLL